MSAVVYLGAHNLLESESTRVIVQSRQLIRHESYNEDDISNDIGVIVLAESVEFNEYISVATLPSRGQTSSYEGKELWMILFQNQ